MHKLIRAHLELTRRHFLGLGAAGLAGLAVAPLETRAARPSKELAEALPDLEYLTPQEEFGTVERGNPLPYKLPPEKLRAIGLVRETWQLEVVPDPDTDAQVERPLSKDLGTALDWDGLMRLAEKHAVRFLKVMTCNNGGSPLGMGVWEGVPLREVVWMTRPVENIRRVFYHGYHNDDPEQLFQSSMSVGRVLEDPPGTPPVILCYKLNGRWLSGKRGGPVRMLVPEAYGFKSVKWLNRVVLSNLFHANDTYARGNNDVDSWLKTFARLLSWPGEVDAGKPIPLTGVAQVGISGLGRVQVWLRRTEGPLPDDDPYFTKAPWQDAEVLAPPTDWGGDLPDGRLPQWPLGFDPETGKPRNWPMRYTYAHWAALLEPVPPGEYELRCRTLDANGIAQPLPRPFPKSGRNSIQKVSLVVKG
jgi:DMSO/TMAO reductase YedYZ molybdopterin-dependent catalytic subunit